MSSPQLRRGIQDGGGGGGGGERPGIPSAMIPGEEPPTRRNSTPAERRSCWKSTDTGGVYLHRLVWGGNIE
ncbi:MAG: hypothetical protein ACLR1T_14845 [Evtepia gabavorous]